MTPENGLDGLSDDASRTVVFKLRQTNSIKIIGLQTVGGLLSFFRDEYPVKISSDNNFFFYFQLLETMACELPSSHQR